VTPLLVVLFLSASPAAIPCPNCPPEPPPKIFHEPFECKKGLVKVKCQEGVRCVTPAEARELEAKRPSPPPPPAKPKYTLQDASPPPALIVPKVVAKNEPAPKKPSEWRVTLLGEVGPKFCGREMRGLVGLRFHHLPTHLGLELEDMWYRGGGGRLMLYPYQSDHLMLHLNAGVHFDEPKAPSYADVDRKWDWAAGAGAELPITDSIGLVADWRLFMPMKVPEGYSADKVQQHVWQQSMILGGLYWRFE
jgi:hypothetical protein